MTDKKPAKTPSSESSSSDLPAAKKTVTEQNEPKSNFAKAEKARGSKASADKAGQLSQTKSGRHWLWLLATIGILAGAGVLAWFTVPQVQQGFAELRAKLPGNHKTENGARDLTQTTDVPAAGSPATPPSPPSPTSNASSQPPLAQPANSAAPTQQQALAQAAAALAEEVERQDLVIAQLQQQMARMQRALNAQASRLGELGNVSRKDWQLAEADYLLRLANQRLLLERDTRATLGLLEEVDSILRRIDLPDLFAVRQQLAEEITALKLVDNIDREGIFLRLRALEEQLLRTNIQPEFDLATPDTIVIAEDGSSEQNQSPLSRSWNHFLQFMQDSVRIRDGDIDPVLLSPQSEARFRQSLRLNMEQAELALLRENDTVFRDSLLRARQLLLDYGIPSHQREVLAEQLKELSELNIEVELPSLGASQSALQNYIERLHKTQGVEPTERGGDTP
ncbi:hypothetical protein Maes01_00860 [Microbulbifer aestuariivivens]|uniref:Uroporphyrin-3 C-methyltransferase n=1 Tax=Microbulbifer aestuariivivens TaxID=1908308 RepID=A0ABP9WQ14_9GAMM